jgi:hypothetical protein
MPSRNAAKVCILVVEYERRLAVEFVYFGVEVRAARRCRDSRREP